MRTAVAAALDGIREAFPPGPITGDGAFAPWGNGYLDAAPFQAQLDGRSWQELDREYLVRRSDALGFLGTRHLAALLPIYLRSMLEEGVWSPAAGMLTLILRRPEAGSDAGLGHVRFDALVGALASAQRCAIAAALHAFAMEDVDGDLGAAALAALDSYWAQYLQPAA